LEQIGGVVNRVVFNSVVCRTSLIVHVSIIERFGHTSIILIMATVLVRGNLSEKFQCLKRILNAFICMVSAASAFIGLHSCGTSPGKSAWLVWTNTLPGIFPRYIS
jgi:hypothetical protein